MIDTRPSCARGCPSRLVPIRVGKIITVLESKSAAGDVHAARELLSVARSLPTEQSIDLATLTKKERDWVLGA